MISDLRLEFKNYLVEDRRVATRTSNEYMSYFDKLAHYNVLNQDTSISFIRKNPNGVAKAFLKSFIEFCKLNHELLSINDLDINDILPIIIIKVTGRKKKKISKFITENEVLNLVYNIKNQRQQLMLLIQYYGALRIGELLSITIANCYFNKWYENPDEDLEIKVLGKGSKEGITSIPTGVAMRLINYIHDIEAQEDEKQLRLFDLRQRTKLTQNNYDMWLNKLSEQVLGIKYSSHSLRHGRITQLMQQGVGIEFLREFARHSSIISTQIYLHNNRDALRNELRKVRVPIQNQMTGHEQLIAQQSNQERVAQEARERTSNISQQIAEFNAELDKEEEESNQMEEDIDNEEFED